MGFGEVETEGFEGDFEFVVVDFLVFVEVEERELFTSHQHISIYSNFQETYSLIYFFSLLVGYVVYWVRGTGCLCYLRCFSL